MKLLIDNCLSRRVAERLAGAGHDVLWAGDWGPDPGDPDLLARAHRDGRVLVTRDKGFSSLAIVTGIPHSGIIRLREMTAGATFGACLAAIALYAAELAAGGIVAVDGARMRLHQRH